MTPPLLFLAGTDTDVGKTTVALGLLALARRQGLALAPYKPAQSGTAGGANDALLLWSAAGLPHLRLRDVCPFSFEAPVAPAVAAEESGVTLDLASLVAGAHRARAAGAGLLVEGAGGLLSPYCAGTSCLDLAVTLNAPVLLVARNGLGTINHTALAVAELDRRRHPLAGILLVDTKLARSPDQASNAAWIERVSGHRVLGTLPHFSDPTPETVADALETMVSLEMLLSV